MVSHPEANLNGFRSCDSPLELFDSLAFDTILLCGICCFVIHKYAEDFRNTFGDFDNLSLRRMLERGDEYPVLFDATALHDVRAAIGIEPYQFSFKILSVRLHSSFRKSAAGSHQRIKNQSSFSSPEDSIAIYLKSNVLPVFIV